jgi:ATP-dependent Clp protease ATP-binding subunit ClpC
MKNTFRHAEALAKESGSRVTTGHVLLSLFLKRGPASKFLNDLGLTEARAAGYLRERLTESSHAMATLARYAKESEAQLMPIGTEEMIILDASFKMKNSVVSDIFQKEGIHVGKASGELLRRVTDAVSKRAQGDKKASASIDDYQQILPLPDALSAFSVRRTHSKVETASKEAEAKRDTLSFDARRRAHRMMAVGSEIELKQRMKTKRETAVTDFSAQEETAQEIQSAPQKSEREKKDAIVFKVDKQRFPLLSQIGRNLVEAAAKGAFEEIVERRDEMERVALVLHKRRSNCPCVVGPSGVGKTALIEGLASAVARGESFGLEGCAIVEVNAPGLLGGTGVRGSLAERVVRIKEEVALSEGKIILFFDNFHTLLTSHDGMEAVHELKSALAKGELPCIAALSFEDFARHIDNDPALRRAFCKVELKEPEESEALIILRRAAESYARYHKVAFDDEALMSAVRLSIRYLHGRALPDKAVALIDTAGARAHRKGLVRVTEDDIAEAAAEQIGVGKERLVKSDGERLLQVESTLGERIIGHQHVLLAVGETLRRNAAGFQSGRPIGSFLFLGPTGVGKTETAKALGEFLFPDKGAFIRLDMSEFSEAHAVARLIGAPPGYVGHEEGGQLTEAVRRRPYSLVLLDEIEKAHPEVLQVLLQILDDGRLTDGLGRLVPFENTIIIMTSNMGCNLKKFKSRVGFGASRSIEEVNSISADVISTVRGSLPPELWNRIDEVLVFEPLEKRDVVEIASHMLRSVEKRMLRETDISFEFDDAFAECLADLGGFDPELGARPMRRLVQRLVEGPIAKLILEGVARLGDTIEGFVNRGEPDFKVIRPDASESSLPRR